ncbi:MAG: SRPBCC domain-containing protein [Prolixibacteraceae bacterium]|jgi:activator of HSP90 ATPase|nr:SRPBCC domain-containing protein [Prolixibacteraceae bacterium]
MKDIHKYYKLSASPEDVYNALTNRVMIEIWTGEKAVFETKENSVFSMWDGSIVGKNIQFEPNKLLCQVWFFDNIESKVTIKLHPDKKGVSVELTHENIPDEAYENIAEGWDNDYFGALVALFNE